MRPLIALCGYASSGKDTAAKGLTSRGWVRVSFADAVRELALECNPCITFTGGYPLAPLVRDQGWERAKQNEDVRSFLQNLGTGARRVLGENVWVEVAERKIFEARQANGVVITDCRFPNEVAMVLAQYGVLVRINRPGVGPVNGHVSETAIDDIRPAFEITNDGTVDQLQDALWGIAETLVPVRI